MQCVEVVGFMLGLTPILLVSNDLLNRNWSCKYKQLKALGRSMLRTGLFKMTFEFCQNTYFQSSAFCTQDSLIEVFNILFFPFAGKTSTAAPLGEAWQPLQC